MPSARCPWCLKTVKLAKSGKTVKHKNVKYVTGRREDGYCSGSEVTPTDWDLRPVKTRPNAKKKRVRKKKVAKK